jgi:hypothetical protein
LTSAIKMFGQSELGRRQRPTGILRREAFFQLLLAQDEDALFAVRRPIAEGVEIFRGFYSVHPLVSVVYVGDFVGAHDAPFFIDPDGGRHVDHVVEPRDQVLGVDQDGVFGLGGLDPFAGVFDPAGVLRDGNDLEILVLQFAVKFLPSWQVKSAASPRRPGNK